MYKLHCEETKVDLAQACYIPTKRKFVIYSASYQSNFSETEEDSLAELYFND